MMSTIIVSMVTSLVVTLVLGTIKKSWLSVQLEALHERINASNSEMLHLVKSIKDKAVNAQAIASNALSSAQRAEAKIVKVIEKEVVNA